MTANEKPSGGEAFHAGLAKSQVASNISSLTL